MKKSKTEPKPTQVYKKLKVASAQNALEEGYRAMASDKAREEAARAWCDALAKDNADDRL